MEPADGRRERFAEYLTRIDRAAIEHGGVCGGELRPRLAELDTTN